MKIPVSVIILTYNEEKNIRHALRSVMPWAAEVFVLDSRSTDRTVEIARGEGAQVFERAFDNFSAQRNWALDHLPLTQEWIFFLDADEQVPEPLWREMEKTLSAADCDGFYINRRLVMFGAWLRWGGSYPCWQLRLFRKGRGRWESRPVNEHLLLEGKAGYMKEDFLHLDHKGLADWLARHNRYSSMEAEEFLKGREAGGYLQGAFFGSQAGRKRFLRYRVWNKLPFRPALRFLYSYVFRFGFLHGRAGYRYARLLRMYQYWIDLKIEEIQKERRGKIA